MLPLKVHIQIDHEAVQKKIKTNGEDTEKKRVLRRDEIKQRYKFAIAIGKLIVRRKTKRHSKDASRGTVVRKKGRDTNRRCSWAQRSCV